MPPGLGVRVKHFLEHRSTPAVCQGSILYCPFCGTRRVISGFCTGGTLSLPSINRGLFLLRILRVLAVLWADTASGAMSTTNTAVDTASTLEIISHAKRTGYKKRCMRKAGQARQGTKQAKQGTCKPGKYIPGTYEPGT